MINIKKFIDKVSMIESRNGKEVVIPINEARYLKDELSKLLLDLHSSNTVPKSNTDSIKIEIVGGKF
jgi:hypothetical protein